MTHWKSIDSHTRRFTDSSYTRLHTPSEYLLTDKQKIEMDAAAKKKADIQKAWGVDNEKNR
jgi:hypothetical protein